MSRRGTGFFGRRRRNRPGAAPGTLNFDASQGRSRLRAIVYSAEDGILTDRCFEGLEALDDLPAGPRHRLWLDITGLGDEAVVRGVAERFGLHPLAVEDAVNVHQRPKFDAYDKHLFIVLRMVRREEDERISTEQISLFLLDDAVITMQERPGDCFDPVRQRMGSPHARLRKKGLDYLAYALVDSVVDFGFPELEKLGDRLEELEEEILDDPRRSLVPEIHVVRRELLVLRRAMWPLREALSQVIRETKPFDRFQEDTKLYLRDTYDHTVQLIEMVETYRELSASLLDVYLSTLGQKTNEVMKTLTLVATIFIPLGFLAGLYGMNFDTRSPFNMPELGWDYGYPMLIGLMATVAFGQLWWFWRKGWLGDDE